jgi:hypothetical protein
MLLPSHVLRSLDWQNQGPCCGTGGSRRLLTVEGQVRSQVRPYGIFGEKKWQRNMFVFQYFGFSPVGIIRQ